MYFPSLHPTLFHPTLSIWRKWGIFILQFWTVGIRRLTYVPLTISFSKRMTKNLFSQVHWFSLNKQAVLLPPNATWHTGPYSRNIISFILFEVTEYFCRAHNVNLPSTISITCPTFYIHCPLFCPYIHCPLFCPTFTSISRYLPHLHYHTPGFQ